MRSRVLQPLAAEADICAHTLRDGVCVRCHWSPLPWLTPSYDTLTEAWVATIKQAIRKAHTDVAYQLTRDYLARCREVGLCR